MQLQVGQRVKWSARKDREMEGTVFAVIPKYTDPVIHVGYKNVRQYRINFSGKLRSEPSYLVVAPQTVAGKKQEALCWPIPKALRLVEDRSDIEAGGRV
jgi:hypothetical protein